MLVHRLGLLRCLGHRLIKLGFVFGRGWQRQVRARSSSMTRPVHRLQLSRSFRSQPTACTMLDCATSILIMVMLAYTLLHRFLSNTQYESSTANNNNSSIEIIFTQYWNYFKAIDFYSLLEIPRRINYVLCYFRRIRPSVYLINQGRLAVSQ